MELFCFASDTVTNIWAGIGAGLWAVNKTSDADMKARKTKSARMKIGSMGLLYCNETHAFTTPFVVFSVPDLSRVEKDVWQGEWHLPFQICPLGSPRKQVHKDAATREWRVLKESTSNVSATMNLTGTTVFVPKEVTADDWALVLGSLSERRA